MMTSADTYRDKVRVLELPYGVAVYHDDAADEWTLVARFMLARDAWNFRDTLARSFGETHAVVCTWDETGVTAMERPS